MTYRKSMSDAIREVQESTIKPYVSMSMGGQYNVLDKDSKVVYSTRDKTLAYDYFKKNFDKLKEEVEQVTENSLIVKAKEIAKKFADSMSKAVAEIEKLEKGLSKNPAVDAELRKYNEDVSLQENESPQQIAKRAQELGVSATVSSKGISISSFKTQAGMEKFMKYIASQGKNMFSIYQDAQGKNLFKQVSYTLSLIHI